MGLGKKKKTRVDGDGHATVCALPEGEPVTSYYGSRTTLVFCCIDNTKRAETICIEKSVPNF